METILVIEDSTEIRENISEILSLENYRVVTVDNGQDGYLLATTKFPDLILCDIHLPDIEGHEVLSIIKNNKTTSSIPFILMTASTDINHRCKGLELGAEDYLSKPFTDTELLSVIKCRIKKNCHMKELLENQKQQYIHELEAMINSLSHGLRSHVCSCLGLAKLLDSGNEIKLEQKDLAIIMEGIKSSTFKMDNYTSDLTKQMQAYLSTYREAK